MFLLSTHKTIIRSLSSPALRWTGKAEPPARAGLYSVPPSFSTQCLAAGFRFLLARALRAAILAFLIVVILNFVLDTPFHHLSFIKQNGPRSYPCASRLSVARRCSCPGAGAIYRK